MPLKDLGEDVGQSLVRGECHVEDGEQGEEAGVHLNEKSFVAR